MRKNTPKKIVIALGGNALGKGLPEQMQSVKIAARAITDLVEDGNQVVVVHGNGPQVGFINNAMTEYGRQTDRLQIPLSVCVAMSQAYIGYDIQNALREEFLNRNLNVPSVVTLITQVRVDADDPAFSKPSKPIGSFMTKAQALQEAEDKKWTVREDSGRGYRRVVASPMPKEIIELPAIQSMINDGNVVICCGGGGIPVIASEYHLTGASAVIDKDFSAELLAEKLDADMLLILTAVEKAAIHFGKPDVKWLSSITPQEGEKYISDHEFGAGSMLPKMEAGIRFAKSGKGKIALITLLERALDGVNGKTGTRISTL